MILRNSPDERSGQSWVISYFFNATKSSGNLTQNYVSEFCSGKITKEADYSGSESNEDLSIHHCSEQKGNILGRRISSPERASRATWAVGAVQHPARHQAADCVLLDLRGSRDPRGVVLTLGWVCLKITLSC